MVVPSPIVNPPTQAQDFGAVQQQGVRLIVRGGADGVPAVVRREDDAQSYERPSQVLRTMQTWPRMREQAEEIGEG